MKHPSNDLDETRARRQYGVAPVHTARRRRRTHESRIRFLHVIGASLALAALSYLATAKAEQCNDPASACARSAVCALNAARAVDVQRDSR